MWIHCHLWTRVRVHGTALCDKMGFTAASSLLKRSNLFPVTRILNFENPHDHLLSILIAQRTFYCGWIIRLKFHRLSHLHLAFLKQNMFITISLNF